MSEVDFIEWKEYDDDELTELIMKGFEYLNLEEFSIMTEVLDRTMFYSQLNVILANKRSELERETNIAYAKMKAEWSNAIDRVDVKALTAKKEMAHKDEDYMDRYVEHGAKKAELERIKDLQDVFRNAHITFRGHSKES